MNKDPYFFNGELVTLRTGGPVMVVSNEKPVSSAEGNWDGEHTECMWFTSNNELDTALFPWFVLERVGLPT